MTTLHRIVHVALSCPSDVNQDKDAVKKAVAEVNEVWGDFLELTLQCKDWESHAVPGVGAYPQQVINETAFADYDVYIGLMGGRFGTPTPAAGSGTEEEFNSALKHNREDGGKTKVLFFFRRSADLFSISLVQAAEVEKFRIRLAGEGVLWDQYLDGADLEDKVRRHLSRILQSLSS